MVKFLRIFIILTIFVTIFSIRYNLYLKSHGINHSVLRDFADQTVTVTGQIRNEPDVRDTTTRIILTVEEFESSSLEIPEKTILAATEKTILTIPIYPKLEIGQKLRATGKIQLPENFQNENGIEFDYVNFLAKDKIYTLMYRPKIEILENETVGVKVGAQPNTSAEKIYFSFLRQIFAIKQNFLLQLQKIIPSPEAELLGGILLGTKRSLGTELEENFRRVGLIHIVVLSGYNVSIIAEAILRFFSFLPKMFATSMGVISILIFAIMVGSGATVIRATIMALLALYARTTGRTYVVNRALFVAGFFMIMHNPMILFYDPSFQLSFLATLGLINLGEVIKKFLKFIPEKFQFRDISSATLSTQITVLPLLVKMTGELSVVAPIVNIITLQVIPVTMLLGFLAGIVSYISETAGIIAAIVPYLFLKYILVIVNFFADLSFAVWKF